MSISKIQSNYPEFTAENIETQNKKITLRSAPNQGDDPLSWTDLDNNFELLRYTLNQVVDDLVVVRSEFTYDDEIEEVANRVLALEQVSSSLRLTSLESDVEALQAINAGTRLSDLEAIDAETRLSAIEDFDSDTRLSSIETSLTDIYTKSEVYTKDEVYTKLESDAKYALIESITPHTDAYTKVESDAKYALIGSTGGGGSLPSGYVLADDFCVGDGVTDDRANLQEAIDSLGEKGGTVLLGNKTYLLASNDGTMPWDLIPDYINTDQSLRGNASDGSLDGTEDHTHPAFRLYAWFRDSVTDDAAGFLSMVGTWNGTEFSGGSDSAGFNYWAASNRAALSLWQGLYQAEYEGSYKDTRHVVVREHVTIRGCQDSCGPGVWVGNNIGATVDSKGSYIKIRNSTTLTMKRDTALANLTVVNDGLNGLVSSFGGYGVRPSADDVTIENCFIGGFEYGVYANWTNPDTTMKGNNFGTGGRLRISSCNMDNINSILVAGSYDITYIDKVHSWPFLTGHPTTNPDQLYTWDWNFFTNRDGIAFGLYEVNDWTKITDCFSYGYRTGFHIQGGRNIILRGCGADNSSAGMTESLYRQLEETLDPQYNVLPGSVGFKIERNTASGWYGDYNAQSITDSDGNGFIDGDEKFYPATGSCNILNCQAAAQEVGFDIDTYNGEAIQMSANQSWFCGTSVLARGGVDLMISSHLADTGGWVARNTSPAANGIVADSTPDGDGYTPNIMVMGIQFKESTNPWANSIEQGGGALFGNKTLGNNITINGQQNV